MSSTAEDLSLLTVLANVAAIRIEHARLIEVEQTKTYPGEGPGAGCSHPAGVAANDGAEGSGIDLAGHNAACRTVGGDYYDFLPYADGRVAIAWGMYQVRRCRPRC